MNGDRSGVVRRDARRSSGGARGARAGALGASWRHGTSSSLSWARRCAAGLAALLSLSACESPQLRRRSIIDTDRVLAVRVEPPEVAPGQGARAKVLFVRADGRTVVDWATEGLRLRWRACVRAEQVPGLSGIQYAPESPSEGCDAVPDALRADLDVHEGEAVVSGELTARAHAAIEWLGAALGDALPREVLRAIAQDVGVPLVLDVAIEDEEGRRVALAFKRMMVSPRVPRGTNPPPPRLAFDGRWLSARRGDPHLCTPEDGSEPVRVESGTEVIVAPEPGEEAWLEMFPVVDVAGRIVTGRENAYYSFFSTAGRFEAELTRAPAREERWTAPAEPGPRPLYVVVRDGHGGTSWCRIDVEVVR
ncbi:MAG: hypothetical protein NZ898_01185 [Myxococcota bacterium]|nr:hypothetical protein [Myxococcota bacterium]MDW8360792.1 hypothetical protein [Myxococcales bacterium]